MDNRPAPKLGAYNGHPEILAAHTTGQMFVVIELKGESVRLHRIGQEVPHLCHRHHHVLEQQSWDCFTGPGRTPHHGGF